MSATAVRTIAISSVAILGLSLGGAQHAESQTRSRQIGPAVFGGTGTRADRPGGLDLSAQLFISYDDDVLADQGAGGLDRPRSASSGDGRGTLSGLSVGLQYAHVGREYGLAQETNNSLNYYPDLDDLTTTYHQVGATFVQRFGRRYQHPREPVRCVFAALFDAALSGAAAGRSRPRGLAGWRRAWRRLTSIPRSSNARVSDTEATLS